MVEYWRKVRGESKTDDKNPIVVYMQSSSIRLYVNCFSGWLARNFFLICKFYDYVWRKDSSFINIFNPYFCFHQLIFRKKLVLSEFHVLKNQGLFINFRGYYVSRGYKPRQGQKLIFASIYFLIGIRLILSTFPLLLSHFHCPDHYKNEVINYNWPQIQIYVRIICI